MGLVEVRHPGQKPTLITPKLQARVLEATRRKPKDGSTHWSVRKLARELQISKLRFASREELAELTGLVPGCVPPFGRPILPFLLYVDAAIRENDRIAFNAGSLTDSMILPMDDYLRLAQPEKVFAFSTPPA